MHRIATFLLFMGSIFGGSARAAEAPIDRAVETLVSQLVDGNAAEYRRGRRVHMMPGKEGIRLVFFTIERYGGGNNSTIYLAAFQSMVSKAGSAKYQLLGFDQIGGNGWRVPDIDHFQTDGDCITLETKSYAVGDPMSHPTVNGKAKYCLRLYPWRSTEALDSVPDTAAMRMARGKR